MAVAHAVSHRGRQQNEKPHEYGETGSGSKVEQILIALQRGLVRSLVYSISKYIK